MKLQVSVRIYKCSIDGGEQVGGDYALMDLSDLDDGQCYSLRATVQNNGNHALKLHDVCVCVDDMEPWGWADFSLEAGQSTVLVVPPGNAARFMGLGTHTSAWYANGEVIETRDFLVTDGSSWAERLVLEQNYSDVSEKLSGKLAPYVGGFYDIPATARVRRLSVDVKADFAPRGTYCCTANWNIDLSHYMGRGIDAQTYFHGVGGYCGLQVLSDGRRVSILSLWDVMCVDSGGRRNTIRASLLYSNGMSISDEFDNEGTGVHCLVPYEWETGKWYRVTVKCTLSKNDHTLIEQWITDLSSGEDTLQCIYDTNLVSSSMMAPIAMFLEDFDAAYAGETRTMEVRNVSYYVEGYLPKRVASLQMNARVGEYAGRYAFGTAGEKAWMITSGKGEDWVFGGKGQVGGNYRMG